jgi:hypothetical protein
MFMMRENKKKLQKKLQKYLEYKKKCFTFAPQSSKKGD